MGGARFEKTGTVVTGTFEAGPGGGAFTIPPHGTPADGITFTVPEKALTETVRLEAGYCTGKTRLAAGVPSNVVLFIKAIPEVTFEQPLRIDVHFVPDDRYATLVGYSIDEQDRFHAIDLADLDLKRGRASFLTFQPMTFTWAYVERR